MFAWRTWLISVVLVTTFLIIIGVVTWLVPRSIWRNSTLKEEEKAKRLELFLRGFGSVMIVMAGLTAFLRYLDHREEALLRQAVEQAQKTRESNLEIYGRSTNLLQSKRVLLNEAAGLAATLVTLDNPEVPEGEIAWNRFERIYHGQLLLYETQEVSDAMIDFRDAMLKWKNDKYKTRPTELPADERSRKFSKPLPPTKHLNSDFMRSLALRLSAACRDELDSLDDTK